MVLFCGYSRGHPNSGERQRQAYSLWTKSIGCLKKNQPADCDTFLRWASNIREGVSYYFSAAHPVDCILDIPNLLCCFIEGHAIAGCYGSVRPETS